MSDQAHHEQKLIDRITMCNDAVYAIVLTLLVLELRLPEHGNYETFAGMWQGIQDMSPKLIAFGLSLALVGSNWISSINLQRLHIKADSGYMILMITYLGLISLTPFICYLIGEYPNNPMSYLVFGIVTTLTTINGMFYLRHCRKKNLYHKDADMKEINKLEKSIPVVGVVTMVMTALAFYNTKIALVYFIIFNVLPFFLFKSLRINHKD